METTETTRQQKVGRQIQRDISEIFQKECSGLAAGALVSVTVVRMSPDFSLAKVYLSVFPFEKSRETLKKIQDNAWAVRMALGRRIRHQLKNVPEVAFFLDDSLEYAEHIEEVFQKVK